MSIRSLPIILWHNNTVTEAISAHQFIFQAKQKKVSHNKTEFLEDDSNLFNESHLKHLCAACNFFSF